METIGRRMLAARQAVRPRMSRDTATRRLAQLHPKQTITPKTLQRLEEGDPRAVDPLRVAALCEVYDRHIEDIAPELIEELAAVSDMLVPIFASIQEPGPMEPGTRLPGLSHDTESGQTRPLIASNQAA